MAGQGGGQKSHRQMVGPGKAKDVAAGMIASQNSRTTGLRVT